MSAWWFVLGTHCIVAAPLVLLDLFMASATPIGRRLLEDIFWEWFLLLELIEAMD